MRHLFLISRVPPTRIWKGYQYRLVNNCILYFIDSGFARPLNPPAIANLYRTPGHGYDKSVSVRACVEYSLVVGGVS